jgi:hypothetical protein
VRHFQGRAQAALLGLAGSEAAGFTNSAAGISTRTAALDGGFYRYNKTTWCRSANSCRSAFGGSRG